MRFKQGAEAIQCGLISVLSVIESRALTALLVVFSAMSLGFPARKYSIGTDLGTWQFPPRSFPGEPIASRPIALTFTVMTSRSSVQRSSPSRVQERPQAPAESSPLGQAELLEHVTGVVLALRAALGARQRRRGESGAARTAALSLASRSGCRDVSMVSARIPHQVAVVVAVVSLCQIDLLAEERDRC